MSWHAPGFYIDFFYFFAFVRSTSLRVASFNGDTEDGSTNSFVCQMTRSADRCR